MRRPTTGERAAFVSAAIGIAFGALFLFAPIHGYCTSSASVSAPPFVGATSAPATFGPQTCGNQALWQYQPIFPMPFFAVLVWSLAPLLGYVGVRMRRGADPGPGTLLVALGLVLGASVFVSFGAAPLFVPFVFVPQLIATVLALRTSRMG